MPALTIDRRTAVKVMMGGAAVTVGLSLAACQSRAAPKTVGAHDWFLEGVTVENCTCNAFCVLNLGAFELKEWHRSACIWSITKGRSNGVDLSGTRLAMAYELPPGRGGTGGSRIYIDKSAAAAQKQELEAILSGDRGGIFASFRDPASTARPILSTSISLVEGESPVAVVGEIGRVTLRRLKTPTGKQTMLVDAVYPQAFGVEAEDLCDAAGSVWKDPDMEPWQSRGGGGIAKFRLSA